MQRERVLLTRYLDSFGTLLGASHARNNVPQRLQLFAPELNLSLLLIGSLLDNRDGTGSGVGCRSPRSSRLGIFALRNHLSAGALMGALAVMLWRLLRSRLRARRAATANW